MGRDPQIEEWAAATAPDVGALQKLLSSLEDQGAVWPQIQAFQGEGSRRQGEEGDASRAPLHSGTMFSYFEELGL